MVASPVVPADDGAWRGSAVLVATHDERLLSHVDRVLHLADGELA